MQLIAAVDRRWAIGRGDALLFSIPEDLRHFRELTWGHTIVYGRNTMATFPNGRPLPGRRNLVLTHAPETLPPGAEAVDSVDNLLALDKESLFVVGGESVYAQLLPWCSGAWITQVDADGGGDRFLPELSLMPGWRCQKRGGWKTSQGLNYRFCYYKRTGKLM